MINVRDIAEGWINYIKDKQPDGLSSELREMSLSRAKICEECPYLLFKETKLMGKTITNFKCVKCGCSFPMMTYAKNKKCPLGKWNL